MTADSFTGKVALITGAARGIGAATAELLASNGASVILADKRDELGRETAAKIPGGSARYVSLDVTSEDAWAAAISDVVDTEGGIDILINAAGIIRVGPMTECPPNVFRSVLETNVVGTFLGMRAVAGEMHRRGGGSIINFSSPQGIEGRYGMSAYTASKFAIRGLTKTAAIELGPLGIRVNTVIPGPTKTAMTARAGWTDEDYNAAYGLYPLGRRAEAIEIARLCAFLASSDASYCTGTDFIADGGVTAGKPRDS
jgi:3alpha(or 20beta)-hydroxysteroid dehydrogenase